MFYILLIIFVSYWLYAFAKRWRDWGNPDAGSPLCRFGIHDPHPNTHQCIQCGFIVKR